jgi:hypothetical protein
MEVELVKYVYSNDDMKRGVLNALGYFPFGSFLVAVSPRLGHDNYYWAHMMMNGFSSFFCSDYVAVEAETLPELAEKVSKELKRGYLLHGLPSSPEWGGFVQILVAWDEALHETRNKQLIGTFATLHVPEIEEDEEWEMEKQRLQEEEDARREQEEEEEEEEEEEDNNDDEY